MSLEEFRLSFVCSVWIWNLLLSSQNFSGRTCPRAVVEVRLGSEV